MSSSTGSPHGFESVAPSVRARGYRPAEVDPYVGALHEERDLAWERAARLTVLAKDMEQRAAHLRETVSRLAPPSYENLTERARQLLALSEEEATALVGTARAEAEAVTGAARAGAEEVARAATAYADGVRVAATDAEQAHLGAARAVAQDERIGSRREVKQSRSASLAELREARERCARLLATQEEERAERLRGVEEAEAAALRAAEEELSRRVAAAESALSAAKRALAEDEESARHGQEDAEARATALLARAGAHAERVARVTDQLLRGHEDAREEMRAHLQHVRGSLASLTGRGLDVTREPSQGAPAEGHPEPDPRPVSSPPAQRGEPAARQPH